MGNSQIEKVAIEHVLDLERQAGRIPEDVHLCGLPYDISSPPRKIEVKAFGKSARGAAIPLEDRQFQAAVQDPDRYYLYVVDNVEGADQGAMRVRVIHGDALRDLLARSKPHVTYWPTFRTADYDGAEQIP
ncbi:DUF3883 domain-containing protein [Actinoplanes sp. NBC_00393]|uniref:DUF3883 domain-containing protein n=1 Tax=Actinoplanes sp. NBC_00393 TaxID=2975953 RepID=UPI002E1F1E47